MDLLGATSIQDKNFVRDFLVKTILYKKHKTRESLQFAYELLIQLMEFKYSVFFF